MTREQIFEQESKYLREYFSEKEGIIYYDPKGNQITVVSFTVIPPRTLKAFLGRYGDNFYIDSKGINVSICIDISDKLKDAEPEKEYVVLRTFDKVLVRDKRHELWLPDYLHKIYNSPTESGFIGQTMSSEEWMQIIPYNDITAPLIDTSDPCPVRYEIEFKK